MEEQQRIAVIGSPGGGKSTLATALADATGLPLIHLDREHWQAGWTEPDKAAWLAHCDRLVAGTQWVIDGNYGSSLPVRLSRATLVVWLDLPTRVCLLGAIRRAWRFRGGGRPDMADGCPERFDLAWLAFLCYIAAFRRRHRPAIAARLAASRVRVVHLTSTAERAAFLGRLESDPADPKLLPGKSRGPGSGCCD